MHANVRYTYKLKQYETFFKMSDIDYEDTLVHKPIPEISHVFQDDETAYSVLDNESMQLPPLGKWSDIMTEYNAKREEIEQYLRNKNGEDEKLLIDNHPVLSKLNLHLFPLICQGLCKILEKVREEQSCYRQKSAFNGLDYLSEYLYNMNINYPKRRENWTYIFDMEWVEKFLEKNPRPFYPFSLIWSREYAALKIQSYMRGYWVRRRDEVQELRMFWKNYKITKHAGFTTDEI
ncbi:IQ domain-containing protein K-like isoform X2 [Anthonomus grandis grandis]|uniref:IQ domain-containing protein K-like isoform X2 n=1 Tax=Anthonomus grandis grandis TaxID=2921223 RepID=UPI0021664FAF|nr:IQ domain-containing protein K-like isoform X2 [Anthonomus grandis grandis]